MTRVTRDRFGAQRIVYTRDAAFASSCRTLLSQSQFKTTALDIEALVAHLQGLPFADRTLFAGVAQLAPGQSLSRDARGNASIDAAQVTAPSAPSSDLEALLMRALEETLAGHAHVALALSGGLDSALVLALTRSLGAAQVTAYVLDAQLKDYSERETALRTADALGCDVKIVSATEDDFVQALADTAALLEEPIYNAHPVAKLLLARALRRDGMNAAVSGDGADQVMKRDASADYLPLAHTLFASQSVALCSPFLHEAVVDHLCALPVDPHKQVLRELGAKHGVPSALVTEQKVSRLAPPIDVESLVSSGEIAALAKYLRQPMPHFENDRDRMRWYTLALTLKSFDVVL